MGEGGRDREMKSGTVTRSLGETEQPCLVIWNVSAACDTPVEAFRGLAETCFYQFFPMVHWGLICNPKRVILHHYVCI